MVGGEPGSASALPAVLWLSPTLVFFLAQSGLLLVPGDGVFATCQADNGRMWELEA